MNSAQDYLVDSHGHGPEPSRPLASWYTQGRSDGLGDRLLMFDNSGTASLELLRFRPEFAATFGGAWPNLVLVHTPVRASWLNQCEIYVRHEAP